VLQAAQGLGQRARGDAAGIERTAGFHRDRAFGGNDGDTRAAAGGFTGAREQPHELTEIEAGALADVGAVTGLDVGGLAEALGLGQRLALEADGVDQLLRFGVFGCVGAGFERGSGAGAHAVDVLEPGRADRAQGRGQGLARGCARLGVGQWLGAALVLTHVDEVDADLQAIEQVFDVNELGGDADRVDATGRAQPDPAAGSERERGR
jgi:hypothetical protein